MASNEAKKYQRDRSKHLLVTAYKLGINEISIISKIKDHLLFRTNGSDI